MRHQLLTTEYVRQLSKLSQTPQSIHKNVYSKIIFLISIFIEEFVQLLNCSISTINYLVNVSRYDPYLLESEHIEQHFHSINIVTNFAKKVILFLADEIRFMEVFIWKVNYVD